MHPARCGSDMSSSQLKWFRDAAGELARQAGEPLFYTDMQAEFRRIRDIESGSEHIQYAMSLIRDTGDILGHGFMHAKSVAHDAAAIVCHEADPGERSDRLIENCLIAGYLHDIRRNEKKHPERAALFVSETFRRRLPADDLDMIVFAIRNHEAFKESETLADPGIMLVSDSLYDGDKFRWGPDNFVYTIWDMAESIRLNPEMIFGNYDRGVRGIEKIKSTFRTDTGKKYGPEFIEKGLEIGARLLGMWKDKSKPGE